MQNIGLTLVLTGFLGIPLFALTRVGPSIWVWIAVWLALGMIVTSLLVWKQGGIRNWFNAPVEGQMVSPTTVLLAGLVFATAGAYVIAFQKPGNEPNAMTQGQIVWFGSVFVLLGLGVVLLSREPKRPSRRENRRAGRNERRRDRHA